MTEAVIKGAPDPSERMTWQQIHTRYKGQWVLLIDVDYIDEINFEPKTAVVFAHGERRAEVSGCVKALSAPVDFARFYIPKPGWRE